MFKTDHSRETSRSTHAKHRAARRGGYLYLAVLFTSLIVFSVVTAGLSLSTANSRAEIDRGNRMSAVRLAESELHRVAARMLSSDAWRTDEAHDVYSAWQSLGPNVSASDVSQVRYRLSDEDASLDDDPIDSVVLTAHAQVGKSHAGVSVQLQPRFDPLPLLNYAVTSSDDLQFENGASLSTTQPVQVMDDCKTGSSGALITPLLECNGSVQMTLRGDLATADVQLPPRDVVATYADDATTISLFSLPFSGGYREIKDIVLSPSINPYGAADSNGVYRINAQGQSIRISNARLMATLVIENASFVDITNAIHWTHPTTPDAILVTNGIVNIVDIDPILSEASRGANFNPPGGEFRNVADTDLADQYPTDLRGLIYTTNNMNIVSVTQNNIVPITGGIICRDLEIRTNTAIRQLQGLAETPPIPFSDWLPMEFVRGSFRRVAVP